MTDRHTAGDVSPVAEALSRAARESLDAACEQVGRLFRDSCPADQPDLSLVQSREAETALAFFALSQLCPPGFLAQQLRLLEQGGRPRPQREATDAESEPWTEAQWPQLAALSRTALGRAGTGLFSPGHVSGPEALAVCLRAFQGMPQLDRDLAARLLLDKLSDYAAGRGRSLRFGVTPSWLARLMVGLADIRPGESVCDCQAGEGSLLAEAALRLPLADRVYWQAREASAPLGLLLLPLSGIPTVFAAQGSGGMGLLPPDAAAGCEIGDDGLAHVSISAGPAFARTPDDGADAMCRHIREALAATGRVVLLTRLGPLFRENAEADLRARLVERNLLDAVIQLPGNVVHQHTAALALLIFDRRREARGPLADRNQVFMADLSGMGRRGRSLTHFEEAHVGQALVMAAERREVPGLSRRVPCAELLARHVWLPSRYLLPAAGNLRTRAQHCRERTAALESEVQATAARVDSLLARLEERRS